MAAVLIWTITACVAVLESETDANGAVDAAAASVAWFRSLGSVDGRSVVWAAVVFLFSAIAWAIE
jgi:hypothetical protein